MDFPLRITENSLCLGASKRVPKRRRIHVPNITPLGEQFFGSPKVFASKPECWKKKRSKQKIPRKKWGKYKNEFYKIVHDMASMSLKIREIGRSLLQKANLDHSWDLSTCTWQNTLWSKDFKLNKSTPPLHIAPLVSIVSLFGIRKVAKILPTFAILHAGFLLIHNQKQLPLPSPLPQPTVPVCCHVVQLLAFEGRLLFHIRSASFLPSNPQSIDRLEGDLQPPKKYILLCLAIDLIKLEKPWNHIYKYDINNITILF